MAQQIHPTAFRLAVAKTWFSQVQSDDLAYFAYHDKFIADLIHGFFLAFGWLTSQVIISHRGKNTVQIKFLVYRLNDRLKLQLSNPVPLASSKDAYSLVYLTEFLKGLLKQRSPHLLYEFDVRQTQSFTDNAKILADWVDIQVTHNPRQFRRVFNTLLWQMKKKQQL